MKNKYVIGVDYGTDSCRVLVVDAISGEELSTSVQYYPRWKAQKYCNPSINQYRQHPLDYTETLVLAVHEALDVLPLEVRQNVEGMSFDMTSCTPALTDENGTPLALLDEHKDNPNAMFVLWKDHTALEEADRINKLAATWSIDYTKYLGGIYSSEWVWAKVIHVLEEDVAVRKSAYSWVEHIDWIPALLTGNTKPEEVKRSRCAAGHKAMWHKSWGGLPSEEFLTALSPYLKGFRERLYTKSYASDTKVGTLSAEWADKLGLSTSVAIGVGAIDCHMGAVGVEIKAKTLVKVIGTSTCDIMTVPYSELGDKLIPGICGQVDGSVLPNMIGLEAGQSAFGDYYAWYRDVLSWATDTILSTTTLVSDEVKEQLVSEVRSQILTRLGDEAAKVSIDESTILANDWINGRRTPDADQNLKATITGLTLSSTAPLIYRAIIEATAYGSKAIIDRLTESGVEIEEVVGIGGISLKSPFVMQTLADVLGIPIKVAKADQACALGAAMYAAVVAGIYGTILEAQDKMGQGFIKTYYPDVAKHKVYEKNYSQYLNFK